jgi:hypothetical protein
MLQTNKLSEQNIMGAGSGSAFFSAIFIDICLHNV